MLENNSLTESIDMIQDKELLNEDQVKKVRTFNF